MDYTTKATGDIEVLTRAMTDLDTIAQSELSMVARLADAAQMWDQADVAVRETAISFGNAVVDMMPQWPAKTDAPLFREKAEASSGSLARSLIAIGGGGHPAGNGNVNQVLEPLPQFIQQTANDVRQRLDDFNAEIAAFNADHKNGGGYNSFSGSGVINNMGPTDAGKAALLMRLRLIVHAAGVSLNRLANLYTAAKPVVEKAGNGLEWVGPRSGGTPTWGPGGPSASAGPSTVPASASPAGADPSVPATDAATAVGEDASSTGPDAATGADAGPVDAAGGGPAGGAAGPGAGGGLPPAGTGGTGLAGSVGTLPDANTAIPGSNLPPPGAGKLPTIPPGGIATPPLAGLGQLPAAKTGTSLGKFNPLSTAGTGLGGGGGLGGAGGGGLGEAKSDARPAGGALDQSIPQAARSLGGFSTGVGQPPAMPAAPGAGATSPAASAGSGMPPPMMPGAGAGAGRAGSPSNGAIRSGGPGRARPAGPTPGIPAGLRGRTGKKDGQAAFPTVPAVSAMKKQRQHEEVDTLQLLDEELWTVEAKSAPSPQRRLAH